MRPIYERFIDKYIMSDDMKKYLDENSLGASDIEDMIYYSPAPIEEKYSDLKIVMENRKREENLSCIEKCGKMIKQISLALDHLQTEGIFSLEIGEYSSQNGRIQVDQYSLYETYDAAKNAIHQNMVECGYTKDDLVWYEITKWEKSSCEKYDEVSRYIIIQEQICFVEVYDMCWEEQLRIYDSVNLNLKVPFEAGDIIEVDDYPFGPKYRVLLLSIGDNLDCCCVQAMYLDRNGTYKCGALKHGCAKPSPTEIGFSPLYTTKKVDCEDASIFQKVSQLIKDRPNAIEDLLILLGREGITEQELLRYIESEKNDV